MIGKLARRSALAALADRSLAIADRGYLLETGRVVGEGPAKTLRDDDVSAVPVWARPD